MSREVQSSLAEMDRKLRELERDLGSMGGHAERAAPSDGADAITAITASGAVAP
jgi:hypothetical protein